MTDDTDLTQKAEQAADDAADTARGVANDAADTAKGVANDAADTAKRTARDVQQMVQAAGFNPIRLAHQLGVKSDYAYIGGFASIGVSLLAWLISRAVPSDSKAQSDRWGIFIGHWAPTFFALGLALKNEE